MAENNDQAGEAQHPKKKETCGIIMPISGNSEYAEEHWVQVKTIISTVISKCGFLPKLVSDADIIGVIHSRIINNIFENPIVVCDVSSRNPNVMFELGLRLAFDKPTIIIKDEKTSFSFDTALIEHIPYDSSLKAQKIKSFKTSFEKKLIATYSASQKNEYTTFLKHFLSGRNKIVTFKEYELLRKQHAALLNEYDNTLKRLKDSHIETSHKEGQIKRLQELISEVENKKGFLGKIFN